MGAPNSATDLVKENARLKALVERLRARILREEAFRHRLGEGVRQLLNAYDDDPRATCVLCRLFPEQQADHNRLHHKLDIQDGALVELPIEPPPDKEPV